MPESGPVLFPPAPARSTARRRARPRARAAAAALLAALALVPAGARAATMEVWGAGSVSMRFSYLEDCRTADGSPFEGSIDFDKETASATARIVLDSNAGPTDIRMEASDSITVTNNSNGTCRLMDIRWDSGVRRELTMDWLLDWPFDEMPLINTEGRGGLTSFSFSTAQYSPPYREHYLWEDFYLDYENDWFSPGDVRVLTVRASARAWMPQVQPVPLPAPAAALGAGLALLAGLRHRRGRGQASHARAARQG